MLQALVLFSQERMRSMRWRKSSPHPPSPRSRLWSRSAGMCATLWRIFFWNGNHSNAPPTSPFHSLLFLSSQCSFIPSQIVTCICAWLKPCSGVCDGKFCYSVLIQWSCWCSLTMVLSVHHYIVFQWCCFTFIVQFVLKYNDSICVLWCCHGVSLWQCFTVWLQFSIAMVLWCFAV